MILQDCKVLIELGLLLSHGMGREFYRIVPLYIDISESLVLCIHAGCTGNTVAQ